MSLFERIFTYEFISSPRTGAQAAAVVIIIYWMVRSWPQEGDSSTYVPLFVAGFFLLGLGFNTAKRIIEYHIQVGRRRAARNKHRNPDDARFATEADLEAIGAFDPNNGIPVGKINGRPFFFPFTHALVVAPAGTQKTVAAVVPAMTHGYRVP